MGVCCEVRVLHGYNAKDMMTTIKSSVVFYLNWELIVESNTIFCPVETNQFLLQKLILLLSCDFYLLSNLSVVIGKVQTNIYIMYSQVFTCKTVSW